MNIMALPYSAVLFVLCLIVDVRANDETRPKGECAFTTGWKPDSKCEGGMTEIYKSTSPAGNHKSLCCTTGSQEEDRYKASATSCLATECVRSTATDLCETLYERAINGKKLDYEEVMRDTCSFSEDGGETKTTGVVALCCPKNSTEGYLVGTYGAEPNEFPHQVKLNLPGNCGGTIYNKKFIITASHCIIDETTKVVNDHKEMQAVVGTNIADMKTEEYVYKVTRAIYHQNYSQLAGQHSRITYNDIALLELDREITFSDKVKALEIAPKGFDPFKYSDSAVIVGWGTMENQATSVNLQKANFLLRSDQSCFHHPRYLSKYDDHYDSMLCVGGVLNEKWSPTAGRGDSGGPAICRAADGKIVLCGVTSFGGDDDKCAAHNDMANCPPSVYTEVSYFYDWIKQEAGSQDPETFYKPYLYGKAVPEGKYDHHVRITSANGKCGGTLIEPDIVVTAAQCIMASDGKTTHPGLEITHGLRDLNGGAGSKTYGIKGVTRHYTFAEKKKEVDVAAQGDHVIVADNYYKDDLAVIRLDQEVPVSNLPSIPEFGDKFYRGTEIAFPRNTTISGQLRSREFRLLDSNNCQQRLDRLSSVATDLQLDSNLLCGVEIYSGGSQCDRDLGGGLICKKGDMEYLCGVQVFRLCEYVIPNGFLNMASYGSFVKNAIDSLRKQ